jgi:hypothetical protein
MAHSFPVAAPPHTVVTIQLGGQSYAVGPEGLRLTPNLLITPDMLPTFGGATVRPLDDTTSDVALVFRGIPTFVPLRLPHAEAHRGAAELGAALARYAPGVPPVFASATKPYTPQDMLPTGTVCPSCQSAKYTMTGPATSALGVAPRKCNACGFDYRPPVPMWKELLSWFA